MALRADKHGHSAFWDTFTDGGDGGQGTARLSGSPAAKKVEKVWLDGKRQASLDKSVAQTGAPTAWSAGYDGTGVKVAVLDTGVDQTHPDLAGQEIAERNFSDAEDSVDRFGHGTHVASTVAGTGAGSQGRYKGVAPGARILDGKVLDDRGGGWDSGIIAGMEWAVAEGAQVVNLSLGDTDTQGIDPLEETVNRLSAETDTLFVIAAGNEGEGGESTVGSPGSAESALTVGAVDKADKLADFSSRGPRVGDGGIKPDLTAPGVDITAAASTASGMGQVFPGNARLRHRERHVDGHSPCRGRRRHPGAAAPGLDRRADQGGAHRFRRTRPVQRVPAGHRPHRCGPGDRADRRRRAGADRLRPPEVASHR
ncbi:hypothetical protein SHKM778_75260 [Streptomyces sp. KM77-8]|uniref:Peptidase S8/S53 domain-containing protein n=1 Tax=Streptomyces haneummycinicus TaxID=3074435 RepID=A0AAT9HUL4_9ACTN